MANLLAILGALRQILSRLGPFLPLLAAAEAAYAKGGWPALIAYVETLIVTPPTPAPNIAELKVAVAQYHAAHKAVAAAHP